MTKDKTKVKKILISSLKPNPKNPRSITDENLEKLCKSIKNFGRMLTLRPMIVDENNIVLGGNMRLQALKKLGYKEIPENWVIKTFDLTEEEKRQFLIKDNIEYGEWEEKILKDNYDIFELKEFNIDIDLDLDLGGDDNGEEPQEDECPALKKESLVKIGDKWLLGNHVLKCGDSTIQTDVEDLMGEEKADMVFTDPPYGISYQSNKRTKSEKFNVLKNDDVELDFMPILELFSTGWIFIWTTWKVLDKWLKKTESLGFPTNMIIWSKGGGGIGDLKKTFVTDYEISLVFNRGNELKGKRIGSVWNIGKDNPILYKHPTQKPVELAYKAITETTIKNQSVLDLFGGSGSTLIACEQLNRKCYMQELDELYCQVIIDRYINFKQNKGEDVFLLKDGKKIPYKEICKKTK